MTFHGQYPFASKITADYPTCEMCTWVWREIDRKFWLKYRNQWCGTIHRKTE